MKSYALTVSESPRERRSPALQRAVGSRIVITQTFPIKSNSNLIAHWLLFTSFNRGPIDKPSIPSSAPSIVHDIENRLPQENKCWEQRVGQPVKDRLLSPLSLLSLPPIDRSAKINQLPQILIPSFLLHKANLLPYFIAMKKSSPIIRNFKFSSKSWKFEISPPSSK